MHTCNVFVCIYIYIYVDTYIHAYIYRYIYMCLLRYATRKIIDSMLRIYAVPSEELRVWSIWLSQISDEAELWQKWLCSHVNLFLRMASRLKKFEEEHIAELKTLQPEVNHFFLSLFYLLLYVHISKLNHDNN